MSEKEAVVVTIQVAPRGPLIVRNLPTLVGESGEELEVKPSIALCRCGASAKKPFCDGSHKNVEFSGERETARPLTRDRAYGGARLRIHDNRVICSHARECVKGLPEVFNAERKPWIHPDAGELEEIIEVIRRCPSGALTYSLDGEHVREFGGGARIEIVMKGPYHVEGRVELKPEGLERPSGDRLSLCRCGGSRNKPFCDGTHRTIEWE